MRGGKAVPPKHAPIVTSDIAFAFFLRKYLPMMTKLGVITMLAPNAVKRDILVTVYVGSLA